MKNNKGYTLVELLVAMAIFAIIMAEISAMMINSSKLFLNGTYEIDLQTEAQQIVQQMEELLIDANVSVNVAPNAMGLSVNDIEIVNYDSSYIIRYEKPDASVSYGNIYLTSTGSYTADHELMGEYVESLSLNMAEFSTASKITLEVLLRNDKYTYSTSKDIYLRNDIGLSGNRATPSPAGDFDAELDVLRFKEYNLSDMFYDGSGTNYEYQFQGGGSSNAYFVIWQTGGKYRLKTSVAVNNSYSIDTGDFLIDAIDPATHQKAFTIKISTKAVKIGAAGYGLFYEYVDTSAKITSPVHVEGIWLEGADSITWTLQAVENGSAHDLCDSTGDTYPRNLTWDSNGNLQGDSGGTNYRFLGYLYVQVNRLRGYIRDDWNSIIFEGERFMNYENYYNAISQGCMFKMVTVFTYSNGTSLTVNSYMYPSSGDPSNAMPPEVSDIFWSNCR